MYLSHQLKKALFISILLLLSSLESIYGQRIIRYNGPYQIGKYQGSAIFDYSLVEKDTIFNGVFDFQQNKLKPLLSRRAPYLSIKGSFEANVAAGKWVFNFGNFTVSETVQKKEYFYKLALNGIEHDAEGLMQQGRPDGDWKYVVRNIKDASIQDTLYFSAFNFKEGNPYKNFEINTRGAMLAGRVLEPGLAHDKWELYSAKALEASESWHFNAGWLEKISWKYNDEAYQAQVFPKEKLTSKIINLDSIYLKVVQLSQLLSDNVELLESDLVVLMLEHNQHYAKLNQLINKLVEAEIATPIKVKVNVYEFTETEVGQLNAVRTQLDQIEKSSASLMASTQLNILKLADEKVFYKLAALNKLKDKYVKPLSALINYYELGVLEYVQRDSLTSKLLPLAHLKLPDTVEYEWSDSVRIQKLLKGYNVSQTGVTGVKQYADNILQIVQTIQLELSRMLEKEERQQILLRLEEEVIASVKVFNTSSDSIKSTVSEKHALTIVEVQSASRKMLSDYSRMPDGSNKMERAKVLAKCFLQMNKLVKSISELENQKEEIDKIYTDDVWNPFTSTVMAEHVKKHIVATYEEVLVPYILNEVENDLTCDEVSKWNNTLAVLYERILSLRSEDTDKLERKLKNQKNPLMLFDYLGIDVNSQTITP